jgi:hypothetical protein
MVCPLNDVKFEAAVQFAKSLVPGAQDNDKHQAIIQCSKSDGVLTLDAFQSAEGTPPDIINNLRQWVHNPAGIPPPVQDDGPGLNIQDMVIYLWVKKLLPKGTLAFPKFLWNLFAVPGN